MPRASAAGFHLLPQAVQLIVGNLPFSWRRNWRRSGSGRCSWDCAAAAGLSAASRIRVSASSRSSFRPRHRSGRVGGVALQHAQRHDVQRPHVGRLQLHLGGAALVRGLQEPGGAQAPAVAGLKAGEIRTPAAASTGRCRHIWKRPGTLPWSPRRRCGCPGPRRRCCNGRRGKSRSPGTLEQSASGPPRYVDAVVFVHRRPALLRAPCKCSAIARCVPVFPAAAVPLAQPCRRRLSNSKPPASGADGRLNFSADAADQVLNRKCSTSPSLTT